MRFSTNFGCCFYYIMVKLNTEGKMTKFFKLFGGGPVFQSGPGGGCPPSGGAAGEGQAGLCDRQAQLVGDGVPAEPLGNQGFQDVGGDAGGQAGGVGVDQEKQGMV